MMINYRDPLKTYRAIYRIFWSYFVAVFIFIIFWIFIIFTFLLLNLFHFWWSITAISIEYGYSDF